MKEKLSICSWAGHDLGQWLSIYQHNYTDASVAQSAGEAEEEAGAGTTTSPTPAAWRSQSWAAPHLAHHLAGHQQLSGSPHLRLTDSWSGAPGGRRCPPTRRATPSSRTSRTRWARTAPPSPWSVTRPAQPATSAARWPADSTELHLTDLYSVSDHWRHLQQPEGDSQRVQEALGLHQPTPGQTGGQQLCW